MLLEEEGARVAGPHEAGAGGVVAVVVWGEGTDFGAGEEERSIGLDTADVVVGVEALAGGGDWDTFMGLDTVADVVVGVEALAGGERDTFMGLVTVADVGVMGVVAVVEGVVGFSVVLGCLGVGICSIAKIFCAAILLFSS